jgi:hypothetical protein
MVGAAILRYMRSQDFDPLGERNGAASKGIGLILRVRSRRAKSASISVR